MQNVIYSMHDDTHARNGVGDKENMVNLSNGMMTFRAIRNDMAIEATEECAWRTCVCVCAWWYIVHLAFVSVSVSVYSTEIHRLHINFYWNASNSTWKISHRTNSIQCAYLRSCFFIQRLRVLCLDNANITTFGRRNTQKSRWKWRKNQWWWRQWRWRRRKQQE